METLQTKSSKPTFFYFYFTINSFNYVYTELLGWLFFHKRRFHTKNLTRNSEKNNAAKMLYSM